MQILRLFQRVKVVKEPRCITFSLMFAHHAGNDEGFDDIAVRTNNPDNSGFDELADRTQDQPKVSQD